MIRRFSEGEDEQRHFDLAAGRIQRVLLDVCLPVLPGLDIGVRAEPARLVGGDYIDLYRPKDGCLVFGLGDSSGKSLAAALNSLMLRYLVRGLVTGLGISDLVSVVTHANSVLANDLSDGDFITFLLGSLDLNSGVMRTVNAGHEPPLLLAAGSQAVATIDGHDIVLGVDPNVNYVEECRTLQPGDIAVFYTDGLTEATGEAGEMYTIDGLKRELLANRALPAEPLAQAMFNAVKNYTAEPLRDDATILVLRRTR